jgi:hypothetical protein
MLRSRTLVLGLTCCFIVLGISSGEAEQPQSQHALELLGLTLQCSTPFKDINSHTKVTSIYELHYNNAHNPPPGFIDVYEISVKFYEKRPQTAEYSSKVGHASKTVTRYRAKYSDLGDIVRSGNVLQIQCKGFGSKCISATQVYRTECVEDSDGQKDCEEEHLNDINDPVADVRQYSFEVEVCDAQVESAKVALDVLIQGAQN